MAIDIKKTQNIETKKSSKRTASAILISKVIRTGLANKRSVIANTKDRSQVRGGGKKPHRQKGTGRARAGSNRSPLWSGGGVTFGPNTKRNFTKRMNKKQKKLVLLTLLSQKEEEKKLIILDKIELKQAKTKELISFISSLNVDNYAIIVLDEELSNSDEGTKIYTAARNTKLIDVISAEKLNAHRLMKARWVVITQKAYEELK